MGVSPAARRLGLGGGLVAVLVVALLATATRSGDGGHDGPRTTAPGTTVARRAPEATTSTTATPGQPVTIVFGGDVHFAGDLAARLASPATALAPAAPMLRDADVAVVNLETAITTSPERGEPASKQFTFRAPPTAFAALAAAGVDVTSMANNHGLDRGLVGVEDAVAAAKTTPVQLIGIGADATAAFAPAVRTVKGRTIAILAATQVLDDDLAGQWTAGDHKPGLASAKDPARLVAAVRAVRAKADTVVVFLHWGVEGRTCPTGDQQALARQLVDAGADIVVGGHAHRVQGAGRMGQALVGYGLGNFAFYAKGGPGTTSGALHVTVDGRRIVDYRWTPAVLRGGVATPLPAGPAADQALAAWTGLRSCTGLTP